MADPTYYLDINGLSKHFGGDKEYNEVNPGIGITRETVNDKVVKALMAGVYENSFEDTSAYVGGHLAKRFGDDPYLDLGISGGLITGYEDNALTPMAALMAQVGKKDLGRLKFQYVPSIEAKEPSLLMMNLGIPF
jgi:phosphohistidine swiveling domain-containing protein